MAGLRYSWFGNIGPYEVHYYDPDRAKQVNSVIRSESFDSGAVTKGYANLEPRLSIKHQIKENQSIKFSFGRNIQYIHLLSNTTATLPFDVWKPSGEHIKPLDVYQTSLGFAASHPEDDWHFSTDIFYKTFDNIIEYKNGADLFINDRIETQLLPAEGYAYGVEVSLQKRKGLWTGEANYTYSRSLRKTTSPFHQENINNGAYYPSNFDRPHIFNFIVSKTLGEKWESNVSFTYQSGRPITPVIGQFKVMDYFIFTYANRNAYRLPATHRMDLSFSYYPKKNQPNRKWQPSWNFGVYNLYAAKNPISRFSQVQRDATGNPKLSSYHYAVLGGVIPFFSYNFKF